MTLTEGAASVPPFESPDARKTVVVGGVRFDLLSEADVVRHIAEESKSGTGGWVITPNVDICRQVRRSAEAREIVRRGSLVVPDGMPLLWASRVLGKPLAERVTGSSLIFTLTERAACDGLSIYLLGGDPGVPQLAAEKLARRYPSLRVVGSDAPPVGFDETPDGLAVVVDRVRAAAPDIVYVGMGFPKQERLIEELITVLPKAWFVGCGAAIAFAAGTVPRAPRWMQQSGLEWAHRLLREPRRLFRRYLVDDLPFALSLLLGAAITRMASAIRG